MIIQAVEILALLLASVISDIKTYKIKNVITLSFALAGLVTNYFIYGVDGLLFSLAGWCTAVAVLFILFALRMLGAGDIKLFAAVGAIAGYKFVIYSSSYSFLLGGLMGVGFLFIRRNAPERIKYFLAYLKNCILTLKLSDYSDFSNKAAKDKFRFSYAAAAGISTQLVITLLG